MNTNVVVIEGNLTREPEIKDAGKTQVASFGIAVSNRYFDRDSNEWKDRDPSFYDISAWGWLAERTMGLTKGDAVIVVGGLKFDSWEKDGNKRNKVTVTASAIGRQLPKVEKNGNKADDDDIPF